MNPAKHGEKPTGFLSCGLLLVGAILSLAVAWAVICSRTYPSGRFYVRTRILRNTPIRPEVAEFAVTARPGATTLSEARRTLGVVTREQRRGSWTLLTCETGTETELQHSMLGLWTVGCGGIMRSITHPYFLFENGVLFGNSPGGSLDPKRMSRHVARFQSMRCAQERILGSGDPLQAWDRFRAWSELRPGASAFEVERRLGSPAERRALGSLEVWIYGLQSRTGPPVSASLSEASLFIADGILVDTPEHPGGDEALLDGFDRWQDRFPRAAPGPLAQSRR